MFRERRKLPDAVLPYIDDALHPCAAKQVKKLLRSLPRKANGA
jgi:hypothetical protein